jgi:hypothetical protein
MSGVHPAPVFELMRMPFGSSSVSALVVSSVNGPLVPVPAKNTPTLADDGLSAVFSCSGVVNVPSSVASFVRKLAPVNGAVKVTCFVAIAPPTCW